MLGKFSKINGADVVDPEAAEEEMKTEEERKRKELTCSCLSMSACSCKFVQGGALGPDAKRQRVTADAETARKD